MDTLFEVATNGFWAATYIIIVVNSFRYRKETKTLYMPLLSGALNAAWEVNAVVYRGRLSHIIWLALDIFIFVFNIRNNVRTRSQKNIYVACTILAIVLLRVLFTLRTVDWMLLSVFVIDLIMALEYVFLQKKIAAHRKTAVAMTKMIGDVAAGWANRNAADYVVVFGVVVFVLNLFYLGCCLQESDQSNSKKRKLRNK